MMNKAIETHAIALIVKGFLRKTNNNNNTINYKE